MTSLFGVLLILLATLSPWGNIAHASCSPERPPKINVRLVPWQVQENDQLNQQQLTQMVKRQPWVSAEHTARGVYLANPAFRMKVDLQSSDGGIFSQSCTHVQDLVVELTMSNPTLYLARELQYARCVANAVGDHEQKHAALDHKLMTALAAQLQNDLQRWVGVHGAIEDDPALARNRWQQEINAFVGAYMESFNTRRITAQRGVDTPEEYHRIDQACPQN